MHTTISLMQAAAVLSISMRETQRLIRQRRLSIHHKVGKVCYLAVETIQAYIVSINTERQS